MFYYLTYEGAVSLADIPDPQQRKVRSLCACSGRSSEWTLSMQYACHIPFACTTLLHALPQPSLLPHNAGYRHGHLELMYLSFGCSCKALLLGPLHNIARWRRRWRTRSGTLGRRRRSCSAGGTRAAGRRRRRPPRRC